MERPGESRQCLRSTAMRRAWFFLSSMCRAPRSAPLSDAFGWVNSAERRLRTGIIVALIVAIPGIAVAAETSYKIRIGFPSLAFSYMPFYVAQEKGIYKKYQIESEYIQMTTSIQPQAVVNGNINYLTSVSTGISAGVAGLPLVIL